MQHIDPETRSLTNLYTALSAFINGFSDKEWNKYTKKQRQELNRRLIGFTENSTTLSSLVNDFTPMTTEKQYCSFRQLIKDANNKYIDYLRLQRDEWIAFAKQFDSQIEGALTRGIDSCIVYHYGFAINEQTDELELIDVSTNSYRQTIQLINPVFSDNYDSDDIACEMSIGVIDNRYRISFIQRDETVTIDFTDLRLETQLFDYSAIFLVSGSVWVIISDALTALGTKKDILGEDFLNAKEKAIWQLGEFSPIHGIGRKYESVSGDKKAAELFAAYAVKAGNRRIAELIRQYSDAVGANARKKVSADLKRELVKPESEALARMILADIKNAASEYPSVAEFYVPTDKLKAAYQVIADTLRARGYKGEYPHFRKMSALKGVRLAEMQGLPVFIGTKKHMASMIDCFVYNTGFKEQPFIIYFTASTVFLKKDELYNFESLDGLSGYFPYKHHRRARSVTPAVYHGDEINYSLAESAIIAAKTAEIEKLTKEERRQYSIGSQGNYGLGFLLIMTMSLGTLFGIIVITALILAGIVVGYPLNLLASDPLPFNEFIRVHFEFPWHYAFVFCVFGFGLPIAVIFALSKKRGG